jgi:hypothetical protein
MTVIFKEVGGFESDVPLVQCFSNCVPQNPCDSKSVVNDLVRHETIFYHNNAVNFFHCFITLSSHTIPVLGNKIISHPLDIVVCIPSATTYVRWHALLWRLRPYFDVNNWNYTSYNTFYVFTPSFHKVRTGSTVELTSYQYYLHKIYVPMNV